MTNTPSETAGVTVMPSGMQGPSKTAASRLSWEATV